MHLTVDGHDGATVGACREQAVEIALGPKGAFENGNVGAVTRRVPANRVVSALLRPRHPPKPRREPRMPRVAELLWKAMEWQGLLDSGAAASQAEIARREGITRARVTQVMGLLRLAPEIQKRLLAMPENVRLPVLTERAIRPIVRMDLAKQKANFDALINLID